MKLLIVANNKNGIFAPFVTEQAENVCQMGVEVDFFGVDGKGILGYLNNFFYLKKKILSYKPDLIHAHYGLSGLLANLQRKIPVVTTYHGSDIHSKGKNLFLSRIAMRLSAYNVFVSAGLQKQAEYHGHNQCVISCGVETSTFFPIERLKARNILGWDAKGKYVLFAGSFDLEVKNSPLAKAVVAKMPGVKLIELRGYTREQVNLLLNAVNCLLVTSYREGSPVVTKEAMACGTPIVSVNVGDIKNQISGVDGCYITSYDENDIAHCLQQALNIKGKTNGCQHILNSGLSNSKATERLIDIYKAALSAR